MRRRIYHDLPGEAVLSVPPDPPRLRVGKMPFSPPARPCRAGGFVLRLVARGELGRQGQLQVCLSGRLVDHRCDAGGDGGADRVIRGRKRS